MTRFRFAFSTTGSACAQLLKAVFCLVLLVNFALMTKPFLVAAFYKFVALDDCELLRQSLRGLCEENAICGTILLAHEGINATVSGDEQTLHRVLDVLKSDTRFADLTTKFSWHDEQPFARLKVKIKAEIVSLGIPEISPTKAVGDYVKPRDWNELIADPDVLVLDTRNAYEAEVGTFARAVNPQTRSFRQFPDWVNNHLEAHKTRKIAMFCTGGIRCEKASALLLAQGFENVYHLEGGILQYLEDVAPGESLWQGECFVFDERVALDHDLQRGHFSLCEKCGQPVESGEKLCGGCDQASD